MLAADDPSWNKEQRRREVKEKIDAMSKQELEDYLESKRPKKAPPARQSSLPTSHSDPVRNLVGEFDLVYPVHVVADHVSGAGNDWVKLSGFGFPHDLRSGGWLYLKQGDRVLARCRALRVEWRDGLRYHTAGPEGIQEDVGAAAVLALDSTTWEDVDFLADERHMQGYRYVITDDDAAVVTHLVGGAPTVTEPLSASPAPSG